MSDWANRKAMENISKAAWAEWFTRGKWNIQQDYTRPDSAKFIVEEYVRKYCLPDKKAIAERELKALLLYLRLPFDGIAVRGKFAFCFDYKHKVSTCYGIAIPIADYNKYWGWQLPLLYLLIDAEGGKLWIHQVQDPSEFSEAKYASTPSYEIKPYCDEPIDPSTKLGLEGIKVPASYEDAIAQLIRLAKVNRSWRWKNVEPDPTDYQEAREKLASKQHCLTPIVARKFPKPDAAKKIKRQRKSKPEDKANLE